MQENKQEKSPIKRRILQYLDYKGISEYEFYKKTGITRGILKQNNGISEINTSRFLDYFPEVSISWLIKGKGKMLESEICNQPEITEIGCRKVVERKLDEQLIPLYGMEAMAGVVPIFSDLSSNTPEGNISIPNAPRCDGATYVTGDSMYPILKSGDIVLFKSLPNNIENIIWGEMYLISLVFNGEEYVLVKYIQKSDRDGYVNLVSHNQHHQAKEFPLSSIVSLAMVKASIRFNAMQ